FADAIAVGGFGDGSCGFKPRLHRGGSGDPCFIATAAYGAPTDVEVGVLRDFRDRYLLTNRAGTACVRAYYRLSPPLAQFIARHELAKKVVRAALVPVVEVVGFTDSRRDRQLLPRSQGDRTAEARSRYRGS
ncbi:MAG: hypothetical protein KAJ01_06080, partial [Candidatus Hydrogenedentes bacterium]|nr:hypothetical protein [Candidatus Hydrogenedentota bacterium]